MPASVPVLVPVPMPVVVPILVSVAMRIPVDMYLRLWICTSVSVLRARVANCHYSLPVELQVHVSRALRLELSISSLCVGLAVQPVGPSVARSDLAGRQNASDLADHRHGALRAHHRCY
eukprot:6213753-Pleurochrysis_carterae.AAC.3